MKSEELRRLIIEEKYLNMWIHYPYTYTWNEDGSVDVEGNVYVNYTKYRFNKLPVKFRKVSGYFSVYNLGLTTFENFPTEILGYCSCRQNYFETLDYMPKIIGGNFYTNFRNEIYARDIRKVCKVGGRVHDR